MHVLYMLQLHRFHLILKGNGMPGGRIDSHMHWFKAYLKDGL